MKNSFYELVLGIKNTSGVFSKLLFSMVTASILCTTDSTLAQEVDSFVSNDREVVVADFNDEIKTMMYDIGIPSMSLSVIENEQIVFTNIYGVKKLSTGEKSDGNTVFEACSLTKPFLLFLVLQLVDQGKLELDKPLSDYCPPYERLEHDFRYRSITTRMILSHTSGIENWQRYNDPDVLEILADPGEKFIYSGEGFRYMAMVIETILGEPYGDYMLKYVIKPLNLDKTYLEVKGDDNTPYTSSTTSNYTYGHSAIAQEYDKYLIGRDEIKPAGLIHTTAGDFSTLLLALLNEKHISRQTTKELLEPVILMEKFDGFSVSMGSGLSLFHTPNDTVVSFSGSNVGFRAEMFYSVKNKRGYVYFSNSDLGKKMMAQMNALTCGVDINLFDPLYKMYPNTVLKLLKSYKEHGAKAMYEELKRLKLNSKLDKSILEELSSYFKNNNDNIAEHILGF